MGKSDFGSAYSCSPTWLSPNRLHRNKGALHAPHSCPRLTRKEVPGASFKCHPAAGCCRETPPLNHSQRSTASPYPAAPQEAEAQGTAPTAAQEKEVRLKPLLSYRNIPLRGAAASGISSPLGPAPQYCGKIRKHHGVASELEDNSYSPNGVAQNITL